MKWIYEYDLHSPVLMQLLIWLIYANYSVFKESIFNFIGQMVVTRRIVNGVAITLTKNEILCFVSVVVKMKILCEDLVNLNGSFDYFPSLAFF
jgi:hypothetical protein